jgi:Zn finger protein HypA/HybF involved in hydrogenase expression
MHGATYGVATASVTIPTQVNSCVDAKADVMFNTSKRQKIALASTEGFNMAKVCENDRCVEESMEQDEDFNYCPYCGSPLTEVEDDSEGEVVEG